MTAAGPANIARRWRCPTMAKLGAAGRRWRCPRRRWRCHRRWRCPRRWRWWRWAVGQRHRIGDLASATSLATWRRRLKLLLLTELASAAALLSAAMSLSSAALDCRRRRWAVGPRRWAVGPRRRVLPPSSLIFGWDGSDGRRLGFQLEPKMATDDGVA